MTNCTVSMVIWEKSFPLPSPRCQRWNWVAHFSNWLCTRKKAVSFSTSEAEEEQAQWVRCWSPYTQAPQQKGEWLNVFVVMQGVYFCMYFARKRL